jgi:hypothetical protein
MVLAHIRKGFWAAVLSLLPCALATAPAGADGSLEYAVKGAYLYKMLPFVDWPQTVFPAPNSPITICILGQDPFGAALDKAVAGQRIGPHPITIRRDATPDDTSCLAVFIDIADPAAETAAVRAFDGRPVLTVTDSGAPAHGIVAFVVEKNHVRFDIDDAAAAKDGLSISSKLLGLARTVKPRKAAP